MMITRKPWSAEKITAIAAAVTTAVAAVIEIVQQLGH
jgi:hypothetical protein